jgi:TIR domain
MSTIFISYVKRDRDWAVRIAQELFALGYVVDTSTWENDGDGPIRDWLAQHEDPDDRFLCVVSEDYPASLLMRLEPMLNDKGLVWSGKPLMLAMVTPTPLPPGVESFERCELFGVSADGVGARLREFMEAQGAERPQASASAIPLQNEPATAAALPIAALMRKREGARARSEGRAIAAAVVSPAPPLPGAWQQAERRQAEESWARRGARGEAEESAARREPETGAGSGPMARAALPPQYIPAPSAAPPKSGFARGAALLLGAVGLAIASYLLRHELAGAARTVLNLLGLAAAPVPPMPSQEAGSITRDVVDASAFAPTRARAGEDFLVQIFLHTPSDARGAEGLAREAHPDTVRRGVATLEVEVERGQRIGIVLDAPGLTIDEPSQSLIWRGEPRACQFVVTVPPEQAGRDCRIRARVLIGAIPVGALRFTLKVVEREATRPLELAGDAAQRYARAFLSHSHEDRVKVLSHAQLLEAAGIKYFQDIASLRAMEHWESRLHQEIDGCDLFLLFWTGSAARSEWVERETRYALARQSTSSDGAPEIAPIFLEPDPPRPPDWLRRSRHFDSLLRLAMRGAAADAEGKPN